MLSLLSTQEVEMLAELLSRAGVNKFEVIWANQALARLRALAEAQPALNTGGNDDDQPVTEPRL